jgi:hypothetical protein
VSGRWVAGTIKARLLLERRLGIEGVFALAAAPSLNDAVLKLAGTAYAEAAAASSLEEAQRAIAAVTLLRLRVLAAWLPPTGAAWLRSLGAWFELCNIEDRAAYLAGGRLQSPYELGFLASAWTAAASTQSAEELSAVLGQSSWGDPGVTEPGQLPLALRIAWADRVRTELPEARSWAAGATAILVAEQLFVARRALDPQIAERAGLGTSWLDAPDIGELRTRLPAYAAWALSGIDQRSELWRARPAWWRGVEVDAEAMVRAQRFARETAVAAVALLALDAVRAATALAVAAHGGAPGAGEVLDALC